MKSILILIVITQNISNISLTRSHHQELQNKFEELTKKIPKLKNMTLDEKEYRKAIFFESVAEIEESNSQNDGRAKKEVNFFSLLNQNEREKYFGFKGQQIEDNIKQRRMNRLRSLKKIDTKNRQSVDHTTEQSNSFQLFDFTQLDLNQDEQWWVEDQKYILEYLHYYLQDWKSQDVQDCDYNISRYGLKLSVKEHCYSQFLDTLENYNYYVDQSYLEIDYNYESIQTQTDIYPIIIDNYQQIRAEIVQEEQKFQNEIKAEFEAYLSIFDNDTTNDTNNDTTTDTSNNTNNTTNDTTTNTSNNTTIQQAVLEGTIPQSVDWVAQGMVSSVKQQSYCGSCWAFSALAMLESMHLMQKQIQVDLSEQQLVSCDNESWGCDGGLMSNALNYILNNGITNEQSFRYQANHYVTCPSTIQNPVNIQSWDYLKTGKNMIEFLKVLKERPVTVGLHANTSFQNLGKNSQNETLVTYSDNTICPEGGQPNHAVQAVGYFVDLNDENNIWVNFKNSWGEDWGNNGFFKLTLKNDLTNQGHGPCQILQYNEEITWATLA